MAGRPWRSCPFSTITVAFSITGPETGCTVALTRRSMRRRRSRAALEQLASRLRRGGRRRREGLQLARALEVDLALDQRHFHPAIAVERVAVEDGQVGVLADLDAAGALVEAELLRAVERDRSSSASCLAQCRRTSSHLAASWYMCRISSLLSDFRQTLTPASCSRAAQLNGMASAASILYAHQSLKGEQLAPCSAISGRDLVAFQDVLQRPDLEAEAVGHAQQHEDLVGAVAVAMDLQVARQHVGQRLQPQVAARLDERLCPRRLAFSYASCFLRYSAPR